MKKNKILFKDFLRDKRVYGLNQNFWKNTLKKVLPFQQVKQENWYVTQYANGKKMYDGNPMYSVLLKPQKSIRIIQEAAETPTTEISAWLHTTEDAQQNPIKELVIVLELTSETKKIALDFIDLWTNVTTDVKKMQVLIDRTLESMVQV